MSTSRVHDKTREEQLIKLAKQGKCKTIDLFEADFGHWPPNDLTISNPPTGEVDFKPSTLTMLTTPRHWPSIISLSSIAMWYMATQSFVKAVAISVISNSASTMGFVDPFKKERTIHINEGLGLYGYFNKRSEYLANVVSHEHFHLMQRDDQNVSLTCAFQDRSKLINKLEEQTSRLKYLADECEFQARMHTVLANVYQQHQRLPLNAVELIAALKSHGVEVPDSVEDELYSTTKTAYAYRDALERFYHDEEFIDHNGDKSAVSDLNKVLEALKDEHVAETWFTAIPRIYGDLLEIYGDAYGSERVGLGHNIQLREIFYREMKQLLGEPEDPKRHLSRAYKALAAMPDHQREELYDLVARDELYQTSYNTEAILVPRKFRAAVIGLFNEHAVMPYGTGIKPYEQKSLWETITDEVEEESSRKTMSAQISTLHELMMHDL